jgi:GTP-binding protein EngB required for normal cell division
MGDRQSIPESVALMEESVADIDTSIADFTKSTSKDTAVIATSIDKVAKVAKYVGYATIVYLGFKIVRGLQK